jgi:transposase
MYYIGLDVHKKTISYCVKDAAGHVQQEGRIGSTRRELDAWIGTLPSRMPW